MGSSGFHTKPDGSCDINDPEYDDLNWWSYIACFGIYCTIACIIGTVKICHWVYLGIKMILN